MASLEALEAKWLGQDFRREGFIKAIVLSEMTTLVAGFGQLPWELFWAYDCVFLRAYGVDAHIIERPYPLCRQLASTLEYHRQDRCPYMHLAEAYFVDAFCPLRTETIRAHFTPVYVCPSLQDTEVKLQAFTGRQRDDERLTQAVQVSQRWSQLILALQGSAYSARVVNHLTYASQFIFDLDERLAMLEEALAEVLDWSAENASKKNSSPLLMTNQLTGLTVHNGRELLESTWGCEDDFPYVSAARGMAYLKEKYRRQGAPPELTVADCQKWPGVRAGHYEGEGSEDDDG